ncbi:MFS transporter [Streptantibioticus cattleyicolor]|uniref:MFS transporter n=1 Tax=Streptantibioticus cattleyicolor TaxID=29303 RepID=UPI0002E9E913|nr:MFS transporter [Streptantibioticus cattleyicolor]
MAAERLGPQPMMPPRLFARRGLVGVLVVAFGYYFASFGALPVLSLWLQGTTGLGPLGTSLVLTVQVVSFFVASALVSEGLHGAAPARVLGGATVVIGSGCAAGLLLPAWPGWPALLPALVITGFGAGIVSPVLPAVAIAAVPPEYGTAGAAANSSRQLGLALGIAACGTLYGAQSPGSTGRLVTALLCCAVVAVG